MAINGFYNYPLSWKPDRAKLTRPVYLSLARQLKEKNAGLIAITCSDQSSAAKLSDITLPYYSSVHRVTTESYDLTSQMPALYLLEALARRVYNRLLE